MKYAWASITQSCTNFGNYQIEYTLKNLLKEAGLDQKPNFSFDAFLVQNQDTIDKINATDFLIIPGCTTLTVKHYPGIKSVLNQIKVPVYNLGAAFFGGEDPESLPFYQYYYQPIGARDPQSAQFLTDNHIPNIFIGCPTLFSGKATDFANRHTNKIVCLFGLKETQKQMDLLKNLLEKNYEISYIVQEEFQNDLLNLPQVKKIVYRPENLVQIISEAKLVITGRLHGALPALALGTPVFFTQTIEDSRFSLLDYLDIQKFDIHDPKLESDLNDFLKNPTQCGSKETYLKIHQLKNKFRSYVDEVLKREHIIS